MRKQLFGGALIAAGLSAPGAAQEFNITGTTGPQSDIIGVDFFVFQYVTIDADFYDESMLRVDSYARTMSSPTSILALADVNSGDFAAYVLHFDPIRFQVSKETQVLVSWDFRGDTDKIGGLWRDSMIHLRGPGGVDVLGDLNNPVGSEEVTLLAGGRSYSYFGNALSLAGEPESFFRIEILSECAADLDGDGDADADDFFAYLDAFAAGELDICDIDGDGDCDADDFFGYLDSFAIPC